jgi:hypothetical protein
LRRWSDWQRCDLIRLSLAHTPLPFADGASLPPSGVCSNLGNGGRRRASSSSRHLLVRPLSNRQPLPLNHKPYFLPLPNPSLTP